MSSADAPDAYHNGLICIQLVRDDPSLGGLICRGRPGPVRDALLARLPKSTRRIHPAMDETALFGGMDVTATLTKGRLVATQGIANSGAPLLLTMADRMTRGTALRILTATEGKTPIFAVDESDLEDDTFPSVFAERLAFRIDLTDLSMRDITHVPKLPTPTGQIEVADAIVLLAQISANLGIDSLRAPDFALRAARALARLRGARTLDEVDVTFAAELVFAHRATRLPTPQETDQPEPPDNQSHDGDESDDTDALGPLEDRIVEAVKAAIPAGLLMLSSKKLSKGAAGSGTGQAKRSNRRGRPIAPKAGRPSSEARLDVVATLRAAAPFQRLRRGPKLDGRVKIRPDDLRIKRFEERSDRLVVFAVDASGSAAMGRLAEAKGAVELLLADAYARRDHVSLLSFRGTEAEVLLPSTRSLVLTKRRLSALPGGGGTPLAAGLQSALLQAITARRRGMTPTICVLTDGRANVALDGAGNRPRAAQDAHDIAKLILSEGIDTVIIDTGQRPESQLRTLASVMNATYVSLPRAQASSISNAVTAGLNATS